MFSFLSPESERWLAVVCTELDLSFLSITELSLKLKLGFRFTFRFKNITIKRKFVKN